MESSSTRPEEVELVDLEDEDSVDDDDDIDDDMNRVLEMLNFKVVPKEPGDPGYSRRSYLPTEAKLYALEFCRFRDQIDILTRKNASLESTISKRNEELETEKQTSDQRIQKLEETALEQNEKVKSLTQLKSVQEDRAAKAENVNVTLEGQLNVMREQLARKDAELEAITTKLNRVENEQSRRNEQQKEQEGAIDKYKRGEKDAQDIIVEREQEIEEYGNVISNLRSELQKAENDRLNQNGEMEKAQNSVKALEGKLENVEKETSELRSILESTEESLANVQFQLEGKIVESDHHKNNLEKSQETIDALEKQIMELEEKAEEQQKQFQEKLKDLEKVILSEQTQLELVKKSLDEEKVLKLNLLEKNKKLRNSITSLNSEFELIIRDLKTATGMPDFSTLFQKPNDHHHTEEFTRKSQEELDGVSAFVRNKFQSLSENMSLMRDELTKTSSFASSLLQILNNQTRKSVEPVVTSVTSIGIHPAAVSTPVSSVSSSATGRQPQSASTTPSVPKLHFSATPIRHPSSPFVRPSYRDMARLPPVQRSLDSQSRVLSSLKLLFPNMFRTPPPSTVPAISSASPAPTTPFTTNAESPSVPSSSRNCDINIPLSKSTSTTKSIEVRQLFSKPINETTNVANTVRNEMPMSSSKVHGVDTSKSHLGAFCLCGQQYNDKKSLKVHIFYYTKEWKFKCHLCPKRFCYLVYLNRHLRSVHKIKNPLKQGCVGCSHCGKKFASRQKLLQHNKTAHSSSREHENMEGQGTAAITSTMDSNDKQHGVDDSIEHQGKYVCLCGHESNSKTNLGRHIQYHTTEPKFACQLCSRRFVGSNYLREHYRRAHKIKYSILKGCRYCGRQFKTLKQVRCHQNTFHAKEKKQKLFKPKNTTERTVLKNTPTIVSNGNVTQNGPGSDHLFSELITGIETTLQATSTLQLERTQNGNRQQNVLSNAQDVNATATTSKVPPVKQIGHAQRTINQFSRKFVCNICSNRFTIHGHLLKHLRRAHKVHNARSKGLFGCRYCGKLLRSMYALQQHKKHDHGITRKKAETQKRPLPPLLQIAKVVSMKSEQSEENASLPDNGLKHAIDRTRTQRDGGQFCICGSEFQKLGYLRQHILYYKAMARRLFKCPVCGSGFGAACYLKIHMLKAHNRNFDVKGCRQCGKYFKTNSELCLHQKLAHNLRKLVDLTEVDSACTPSPQAHVLNIQKKKVRTKIVSPGRVSISNHPKVTTAKASIPMKKVTLGASRAQKQMSVTRKKHGVDMSKRHLGCYCICGIRCSNPTNLQHHIMYFTKERKFRCELCGSSFLYLAYLKQHMGKVHHLTDLEKVGSSGCKDCGRIFSTHHALMQHRKSEHSYPSAREISIFSNRSSSTRKTPKNPSTSTGPPKASTSFNISIASTSSSPSSSNAHSPKKASPSLQGQHGIDLLKLPRQHICMCGIEFESMKELQGHVRLNNQNKDQPSPKTFEMIQTKMHKPVKFGFSMNLFYCFCGSQFDSNQLLQKHIQEASAIVVESSLQKQVVEEQTPQTEKICSNLLPQKSRSTNPEIHVDHNIDTSKQNQGFFCTCGFQLDSKDNLAAHIKYFKLGKRFQCGHCSKTFCSLRDRNGHMKRVHKIQDVTGNVGCRSCGVIFPSKHAFCKHQVKIFTPERKLADVYCPSRVVGLKDPAVSSTDNFSNRVQPSSSNDSAPMGANMKRKRLLSPSSTAAQATSSSSRNDQSWIPVTPSISVRIGPSNVGAEITTPRNEDESPVEEETEAPIGEMISQFPEHAIDMLRSAEGHFCHCGRQCSNKHTLNRHIKRFTSKQKRKFICKNCGETFTCANFLRKHMLRVHKIVQTVSNGCKDCGEIFPSNFELYNHYKVFHNLGSQLEPWETKYTPPVTSSSSQSQELSQEQPIELNNAGASGTVKSSELKEKENHQPVLQDPLSENLNHQCSCGKVFTSPSLLRRHIRLKANGKIFKCSWCPISFDVHNNLKKHVKSVHKVDYQNGKFACGICAKTFPSCEEVRNHRRSAHENNKIILRGQQQHVGMANGLLSTTVEAAMNAYET